MKPFSKSLALACLALAALATSAAFPSPASAQTVPGVREDPFADVARYRAEVFGELTRTLDEWERAVMAGEMDTLREFYTDEALFLLEDGTTLIGPFQVAEQVLARFSRADRIDVQALDFDMSDRIAVVGGRMTLGGSRIENPGLRCFSMAFKRDGRTWRIRSQTFCALPEPVHASSP